MCRPLLLLLFCALCACGSGGTFDGTADDDGGTTDGTDDGGDSPPPQPPPRRVSAYEVDPPYLDDPQTFWARTDLFVMSPDLEPLDEWPQEVIFPADHGVRIIVLLPGDYRGRSDGSLPAGVLMVRASGTPAEPLLVTYAPSVGADLRDTPHPVRRRGEHEAQLGAFRLWNENHQYVRGLTFADGISACWIRETTGTVIDRCLWHETGAQPLRIRFGAHHNLVQRCVFQRFQQDLWGANDTVAIQVSDGACTHNRIVSNVMLNYTDSYQHTDRDGEDYGLGAGTIIDNNAMGFTPEAYREEADGQRMCGENSLDFKMGGTQAEPIQVTDNVFFGVRAAQPGCAASGSGGYAVTLHRLGTWIEFRNNLFVDVDAGVFLNGYFLNNDPSQGRIDPHLTLEGNVFSGVRSHATAFPAHTGHVLSGISAARFTGNTIVDSEILMGNEPLPNTGSLVIEDNVIYGSIDPSPRDLATLQADGNTFLGAELATDAVVWVPWVDRAIPYRRP